MIRLLVRAAQPGLRPMFKHIADLGGVARDFAVFIHAVAPDVPCELPRLCLGLAVKAELVELLRENKVTAFAIQDQPALGDCIEKAGGSRDNDVLVAVVVIPAGLQVLVISPLDMAPNAPGGSA